MPTLFVFSPSAKTEVEVPPPVTHMFSRVVQIHCKKATGDVIASGIVISNFVVTPMTVALNPFDDFGKTNGQRAHQIHCPDGTSSPANVLYRDPYTRLACLVPDYVQPRADLLIHSNYCGMPPFFLYDHLLGSPVLVDFRFLIKTREPFVPRNVSASVVSLMGCPVCDSLGRLIGLTFTHVKDGADDTISVLPGDRVAHMVKEMVRTGLLQKKIPTESE